MTIISSLRICYEPHLKKKLCILVFVGKERVILLFMCVVTYFVGLCAVLFLIPPGVWAGIYIFIVLIPVHSNDEAHIKEG